jgi:hypothetical protein
MSLLYTVVLAWLAALGGGMMTLLATGEAGHEAAGLAVLGSASLLLASALWYVPALAWATRRLPALRTSAHLRALFAGVVLNAPVGLVLLVLERLRPGNNELMGRGEAWLFGAMFLVLAIVIALGPGARRAEHVA